MNIRKIAILSIALLLPLTIGAQKKKKHVVKKPVVEVPQEDPRITNMREMTQQIIIIDSIVTDKDQLLSKIRLSAEAGSILTHQDFFGGGKDDSFVYLNEMGNKVYFSQADNDMQQQLFTSDKLGNEWSPAVPLQGISDGINDASCPFMLSDGITFYFAGKGEESIGGYDIFLTRYDSHSSGFFKPENIGMPFNSEANDYMFAIDEVNRIGYFVSDRRQPEGKVCIYIFIPSDSRKTYDPSVYTEQQIRDFADITRISDTWGNGKERKSALARLKAINTQKPDSSDNLPSSMVNAQLVINDALTYSSASDFRSKKAAALYKQLINARKQLNTLNAELNNARDDYAKASPSNRQGLSKEMIQAEHEVLQLNARIKSLEKQTRNEEIKVIN